ncbi:DUF6049 family protein [uncultured Jatrophihabitans sp.]|uniref:DUF6049 family protein n=1 Tax=uncultured Jatrophihabitans sp. TaxID=1610747 RepID=UPI0035CA88AA
MNGARFRRIRAVLAGAAIAAAGAIPVVVPAPVAAAAPSSDLRMQVIDVSPSAPNVPAKPVPLVVTLRVTNTGVAPTGHIRISGVRGDIIDTRAQLGSAFAHPQTSGQRIRPTAPVALALNGEQSATVRFTTTVGAQLESGICLCAPGVYPLSFTAQLASGSTSPLATATTYLPSYFAAPQSPVSVSWLWPLIDRPHRLYDDGKSSNGTSADDVFTDDSLTTLVSPGGRLRRALDTMLQLERTGNFPVTLLVDPELLDELYVMQSPYFVRSGNRTVPEPGRGVARVWLDDLTTLLETRSAVDVQLTPYADPDVQSLHAHPHSWTAALPATMRQRVSLALPGRKLQSQIAWPPSGSVSSGTLGDLVDQGVRTVVVSSSSVSPQTGDSTNPPVGVARVIKHNHTVAAALTDAAVEHYAAAAVTQPSNSDDTGAATAVPATAELPQLVSEVSLHATPNKSVAHSLVITPPRYVDPDPAAAVRAIRDTSAAPFARAMPLSGITAATKLPRKHSHLPSTVRVPGLPSAVLTDATTTAANLPKIGALLDPRDSAAAELVAGLPVALQRSESAAWVSSAAAGRSYAHALRSGTDTLVNGVDIRKPASGSYTLGSSNSPLPIAVRNNLPYSVRIGLQVTTVNGAPGITVRPTGTQVIAAHDQRTIRLPARVERTGRIRLRVQLTTSRGQSLGEPVPLSVDSTALGVVGVVITIVAGAVLLIALLLRLRRRLRELRARRNGTRPAPRTQPVGAMTDGGA